VPESAPATSHPELVSAEEARLLLLDGLALTDDPGRPAGPRAVLREIQRLGFVQVDSIHVVERAHHHILWVRLHRYRPATLSGLLRRGEIFEHWTHDAALIPSAWFPHWRDRFASVEAWSWSRWLVRQLGPRRDALLAEVLERIRVEGPLRAAEFEDPEHEGGGWWEWKPAKAALEYLWRSGALAIRGRSGFQKIYDLTERVLPHVAALAAPPREEHVDWACRGALTRLGVATPRELSQFFASVTAAEATTWAKAAIRRGEAVPVCVAAEDGAVRPAVAVAGFRQRARALRESTAGGATMRLLSPFDPLVRDRARCLRLFGFDYRLEAYTPAEERRYGYYTLPILEGTKLVGRLDPKMERDTGILRVRRVHWEPGIRVSTTRRRALGQALDAYAELNGATRVVRDRS
jgi:uncharacterized protein YcaQ